ncbi:nuclease-related domain-containing protein [Paenibacillus sp. FSL H7-0326]|uniref:nuclease-related domain-containing protein n=1 Tax=Paenibacillus sp. FSL H7-0326 TaxID=1921144 RepID=UPI002115CFBA|nr:nuclease-related domain-containing protein [Paenibacillus sp. FSL H7-0326]
MRSGVGCTRAEEEKKILKQILSWFKSEKKQEVKKTVKNEVKKEKKSTSVKAKPKVAPTRIGELGEHKINIQLDQLPQECRYISDLMLVNPKSRSGYSQIDHVVVSPYALFVIETKNYNGEIKGKKEDREWSVSNRFKLYNPLRQNYGHIKAIQAHVPDVKVPYVSIISFTMRCRFNVDPELRKIQSNELIIYDVELSEFIQRKINRLKMEGKSPILSETEILEIVEKLKELNITDSLLREQHVIGAKKLPSSI